MSQQNDNPPSNPPPTGAPVITSQVDKKPWYKKTWFFITAGILGVAIIGSIASGNSDTTSSTVVEEIPVVTIPDFTGVRLDVAISDMGALDVKEDDIEIVGGGAFGAVDETNWFICEQTPIGLTELIPPYRFIIDRSCDTEGVAQPQSEQSTEEPGTDEAATTDDNSTTPVPDSPIVFRASVSVDITDMRKDLNDLNRAIKDDSVFRILSNVAEISFNLGQLGAANPPLDIANEWNEEMMILDEDVTELSELVSGDGTTSQVQKQVKAVRSTLNALSGIVDNL